MSRSRVALFVLALCAGLLVPVVPTAPATAASSVLCSGFSSCAGKGYDHHGYDTKRSTSYWRMYTGTNCTNYAAYRLVSTNGMPNTRPKAAVGNARDWGKAMASVTDATPAAGSIAWWGKTGNHVAYVEKVVSSTEVLVSESNWSGAFDWRRITKGSGWPDGFIHFADLDLKATKKPAVSGVAKVGGTLKASTGSWTPSPTTYAYQWLAGGKKISGATKKTYQPTAAQLGKKIAVSVTASRASYPTATATSSALAVEPGVLSASKAPAVTGTPRVDSPLTASPGTWTPAADSYAYQWLVDGAPVDGATASTFTPDAGHVAKAVSVRVTATRAGYADVSATSAPSAPVALAPLSSSTAPAVSGTAQVGVPLTAKPGTWSRDGLTYAYQWLVKGTPVAGATAATFAPRPDDLGKAVSVRVTATRPGYTAATATSRATAGVRTGQLKATAAPAVKGTLAVGQPLTASPGTWQPAATFTYQWLANGTAIKGATARTFTLRPADLGVRISVQVTAAARGYATARAVSASTAAVAAGQPTVAGVVDVKGTARLGKKLGASVPAVSPQGARVRYQWLRDGARISGATKPLYTVRAADLGHRLSARVTLSAPGYAERTLTSARTGLARSKPAVSASAKVSGRTVTWTVKVTAKGVSRATGTVTIRPHTGARVSARLVKGRAVLVVRKQARGKQPFQIVYGGSSTVATKTLTKHATLK